MAADPLRRTLSESHALASGEIEQLMRCSVVRVQDTSQIELLAKQLRATLQAHGVDRLQQLLCLLVRAEIAAGVETKALGPPTLRLALRHEQHVSSLMASCVRLARVLACKLDALNGLEQICEHARL